MRPQLVNDEIYHIISRGTGDSVIFQDENDYYRGVFSLYEFNTINSIEIRKQRELRKKFKASGGATSAIYLDKRDFFVEILAFCFMPNHIHLLLRQIKENGITNFMRKVGTGYANYFNKKYNRKGHLFQGRFLPVHIKDDKQLKIVFAYIHANPVSIIEPGWKEKGIKEPEKAILFLENYKWSSYLDYIGKKNFPSVTKRDFLLEVMGNENGCRDFMDNWINYKKDINNLNGVSLE